MNNTLQRAMLAADDVDEADAVGLVEAAAAEAAEAMTALTQERARVLQEERQRELDAALADAVEMVARQRARLGRRTCSRHDGETIRRIFELLRGLMAESAADADPSFQ